MFFNHFNIFYNYIYVSFVLRRCMPLSQPSSKVVVAPTGLWGALSKELPELPCLELYFTEDKYKKTMLLEIYQGVAFCFTFEINKG